MNLPPHCLLLLFASLSLLACNPKTPFEYDCVPQESVFADNIAPILESRCSECHGPQPDFGAPYPLGDYADLTAGDDEGSERKVDAMIRILLAGDMPPDTSPQLSHQELDTLVGWASCGTQHPDPADELVANRPIWEAGDEPPAGATAIDLLADNQVIGPEVLDDYRSFEFRNVVNQDMFVRRIEPVIDDSRVLHHITLTYEIGYPYLYAWAPGTGPIQFPDGGMRIRPNDGFSVEIHYNNGAGVTDAVDSSGIRLWVEEPADTEWGMMSPSTWDISVPAGESASAVQECTATMDFEILAGMPHMHEIGSEFTHDVIRADGTVDNLIELTGWSFEAQYYYEMPMQIFSGDKLRMVCTYDNDTDRRVTAGLGTSDEMCFDFLVVQPAGAAFQCAF